MGLTLLKRLSIGIPQGSQGSNVNPILEPIIHNFIVTAITDVTMTIQAYVNPNNAETTVSLFNGVTEIPLPNIPIGDTAVLVTYTITGLLPYTNYSLRLEATNSAGTAISNTIVEHTLEPVELTDGNWAAMYEFDGEHNVTPSANLVSQLRDNSQGNVEGDEIVVNGEFNDTSQWTLNGAATISGGKCNLDTSGFGGIWNMDLSSFAERVYNIRFTIDSIAVGKVRSWSSEISYGNTGSVEEFGVILSNGYIARIGTYNAVLQAVIDYVSQKEVLGKHLVQRTSGNRPLKETAFIEFDGVDNWMRTGNNFGTLGTVYAYVQKIGTDEDFVMQNNLTGLGEFGSGYLRIGSNIAGSSFYNFRLKRMWIRTVTDDAGTIAKLNEWFSRQEVPLGVTPYGVYDNDAVFANQVVWNNGE